MVSNHSRRPLDDSRAVLIGVAAYDDPDLPDVPAAANSVDDMQQLLADPQLCGWPSDRLTVIHDPKNTVQLTRQMRRLAQEATGTLLIYFVGHGTATSANDPSFHSL